MISWGNIQSRVNLRSFKSVSYLLKRNIQPKGIHTVVLNTALKNEMARFPSDRLSEDFYVHDLVYSFCQSGEEGWPDDVISQRLSWGSVGWLVAGGQWLAGRPRLGCLLTPGLLWFPLEHILSQPEMLWCTARYLIAAVMGYLWH